MAEFRPALLDEPLTPIEAVEFRSLFVKYIRTFTDDIIKQRARGNVNKLAEMESPRNYYLWLASEIADADIVLWDEVMHNFARDGQTLFPGFKLPDDLLSRRPEFWLFNYNVKSKHPLYKPDHADEDRKSQWISQAELIWPDQKHSALRVYEFDFCANGQPGIPFIQCACVLQPGYTYPPTIAECDFSIITTAEIEFLKSPIVQNERENIPRHIRRQVKRENLHGPVVRVIRLRRVERKQPSGSGGSVDYQHQWLVRPHWRNQYYSSSDEHKPVFIDAYIKGPEDKPFKPPKDYVFKVDR